MNIKPKTLTRKIPIRLTERYWNATQRAAQALETTPTGIIRIALRQFLQRAGSDLSENQAPAVQRPLEIK